MVLLVVVVVVLCFWCCFFLAFFPTRIFRGGGSVVVVLRVVLCLEAYSLAYILVSPPILLRYLCHTSTRPSSFHPSHYLHFFYYVTFPSPFPFTFHLSFSCAGVAWFLLELYAAECRLCNSSSLAVVGREHPPHGGEEGY